MKCKTYYYSKDQTDDFGTVGHYKDNSLREDFVYLHKSLLWRVHSWILYYLIAWPILRIILKIKFGVKVHNKKVLKNIPKKQGFFLFGNHTQYLDAIMPQVYLANFRRTYIISHPDAVKINGFITFLIMSLGGLPLPTTLKGARNFKEAMKTRLSSGGCIAIYPEATVWPYYTGVRPFPNSSFKYPIEFNAPIVLAACKYRKPKGIFKHHLKPRMDVYLNDVIYTNQNEVKNVEAQRLHDLADAFFKKISGEEDNVAFNKFILKDDK